MQPILVSCEAPFRSNMQKKTNGQVSCMQRTEPIVCCKLGQLVHLTTGPVSCMQLTGPRVFFANFRKKISLQILLHLKGQTELHQRGEQVQEPTGGAHGEAAQHRHQLYQVWSILAIDLENQ